MSYTVDQLTTLGEFAKKYELTPATVHAWVKDAELNPVQRFGNTRLFVITDLEDLAAVAGSGKVMRAMGYVHPKVHAEAIQRISKLCVEINEAQTNYIVLSKLYDGIQLENEKFRKELLIEAEGDESGHHN